MKAAAFTAFGSKEVGASTAFLNTFNQIVHPRVCGGICHAPVIKYPRI